MSVTLEEIRAARERIRPAIYRSPCPYSLSLSRLCGMEIYCKLDHLQMTGSFKERGARNKMLLLTPPQRQAGVIAASAGNHALGVSYHGQLLGIAVTVVMPDGAPLVKVENCRGFGARVVQHGQTYEHARTHALELSRREGMTYIPGFDDPAIIAGAGTIGLEILEDLPDCDAIIVPIGGGGLMSGIATAVKAQRSDVRLIGVQANNAPGYLQSKAAGKVVTAEVRPTLADGLAVPRIGSICFDILNTLVDQVVSVDESQIAKAIVRLLELEKAVVEGAGATPLAAAMSGQLDLSGRKVVLVLCGGNIDLTTVSRIIERGLAADGRLCRLTALTSDRPGSLAQLTQLISTTGASVKEVVHDRAFGPADVSSVAISVTLETRDHAHVEQVKSTLLANGISLIG